MISAEDLKSLCLSFAGSREEFPFDDRHSVFKVGGKIFAISALDGDPPEVSLKCEPDIAESLRVTYPAIRPGYHLNKRHWNTCIIDGSLPDELVRDMVEDSYDLVVDSLPRSRRPYHPRDN